MRKTLVLCCLLSMSMAVSAQWKPAGEKIKTEWAEKIDPKNVLPEYPRPILERPDWQNLNGLWEYTILPKGTAEPAAFSGDILVPFAIESSLSGVQKTVGEQNELWYKRTFTIPSAWKKRNIVLNFGAVDWKADVFVNDILIGSHTGGFTPFSFDITPYLNPKGEQKLVVRVWDGSDKGFQPVGKQAANPQGIWYTAVTGIWQTVWLEPVSADNHIVAIKSIPDVDAGVLNVDVTTAQKTPTDVVEVVLLDGNTPVAQAKSVTGIPMRLNVPNPKLWSPDSPFLYTMQVKISRQGEELDKAASYTAMRKISAKPDANGIMRMQLNNENLFHFGMLDQGWWPDGLYTAPTDEALLYDIKKQKEWGYNMIRKHVKVEPARWYYHCDKEGIMVWQDMPSGDHHGGHWAMHEYNKGTDMPRSEASKENYYAEWKAIMDMLISYPSIVVWVPFNEAWGQFDTETVTDWTRRYDPSRLINPASGGNHRPCGDILDLHNYPGPRMYLFDASRVNVLGEYGGIGLPLEDHLWKTDGNWGYIQFKNADEVTAEYVKYANQLIEIIPRGFAGAVYTQTTDVEGEVNGLMTYDRKVIKINEEAVRNANQKVIKSGSK